MFKKLILAVGLLVFVAGSAVVLFAPSLRERAESVPRRIETWWREQQPHDLYVPPPAEVTQSELPTPNSQLPTARPSTPTLRPTDQASRRPTDQPTVRPIPAEFKLTSFKHDYQGWNNCGPTTLSMLLSHFGFSDTQKEIAPILKPNENDKNVSPNELAAYAQSKPGLNAAYRVNGSVEMLKQLIANGFPVIVETWFTPKPNDGMGHYRLLIGYSDAPQKFFALDSYNGPNVQLLYADFDADWKAFNRLYLVAYRPEQSGLFDTIIGEAHDDRAMWAQARKHAEDEIAENDADAFAWHNLGSALHALGQDGDAAKTFDRARKAGLPWRMLWYQFAIFDSYLAVGRNQDVLDLTAANLRQASDLEESHFYRGRALQALGKTDEAIKEYREALRLNPNYAAAAKAIEGDK